MERLDLYEELPKSMARYLSQYGWHFSKAMFEWAVSRMTDRNGKRHQAIDKETVETHLRNSGVTLDNNTLYDAAYVFNMAISDYYGSSLPDYSKVSLFVKDYLDDVDGSKTRALDEFVGRCIGAGCPIEWEDVL